MDPRLQRSSYLLKRKLWKIFNRSFSIFDAETGEPLFFSQEAIRLREEIRFFADETRTIDLLTIKARKLLAVAPILDVTDPAGGQSVGALQRRLWKMRAEWALLDIAGQEFGMVKADRAFWLIRRSFTVTAHGQIVARFIRMRRFFQGDEVRLDFAPEGLELLDPRLGLAAAVVATVAEEQSEKN